MPGVWVAVLPAQPLSRARSSACALSAVDRYWVQAVKGRCPHHLLSPPVAQVCCGRCGRVQQEQSFALKIFDSLLRLLSSNPA